MNLNQRIRDPLKFKMVRTNDFVNWILHFETNFLSNVFEQSLQSVSILQMPSTSISTHSFHFVRHSPPATSEGGSHTRTLRILTGQFSRLPSDRRGWDAPARRWIRVGNWPDLCQNRDAACRAAALASVPASPSRCSWRIGALQMWNEKYDDLYIVING